MMVWHEVQRRALFAVISGCLVATVGLCLATDQAVAQKVVAERIAASNELLDINTATAAQLKALPGMGDAYVARIIAGRPYGAKNQLTMRGILPVAAYEEIRALIVAHRPKP